MYSYPLPSPHPSIPPSRAVSRPFADARARAFPICPHSPSACCRPMNRASQNPVRRTHARPPAPPAPPPSRLSLGSALLEGRQWAPIDTSVGRHPPSSSVLAHVLGSTALLGQGDGASASRFRCQRGGDLSCYSNQASSFWTCAPESGPAYGFPLYE